MMSQVLSLTKGEKLSGRNCGQGVHSKSRGSRERAEIKLAFALNAVRMNTSFIWNFNDIEDGWWHENFQIWSTSESRSVEV